MYKIFCTLFFTIEELLTPQQIYSYFSRFAAKRRQLRESEIDAVQLENTVKEATKYVMVALQQESNKYDHPIVFNEFKLCEMSTDELSMLPLTTLKAISEEFDLQVSGRRKAPYVDCVVSFVPARLRKSCMQLKVKVSLPSCTWTAWSICCVDCNIGLLLKPDLSNTLRQERIKAAIFCFKNNSGKW